MERDAGLGAAMEKTEEKSQPARESILSAERRWWAAAFWLFVGQLALEGVVVGLDEAGRLSGMSLMDKVRFIRSELSDDILVSAVIAIALTDLGRYAMVTAGWFQEWVEERTRRRRERMRAEAVAEGKAVGIAEGVAQGQDRVLRLLDEDTREEVERKLRRNGDSETRGN